MRKRIWLGAGVGIAAITATLVWLQLAPDSSQSQRNKGVAEATPLRFVRSRNPAQEAKAAEDIEALLKKNSAESWGKIGVLYPGANEETKRQVLQHIAGFPEINQVLSYLLATVGDDPIPAMDDPMVLEVGELLKRRWKKPQEFNSARQLLLAQKTEKRQWLLANALITSVKAAAVKDPAHGQTSRLTASLIDIHSAIKDPRIKSAIVDGMHGLGSGDAAIILAKGTAVTDQDLKGIREEEEAARQVLDGLDEN